ncbi:hypothetical protein EYC84_009946 [Monilinia fructicola]|uniref:CoA-binding domain-containing protein n=1 Tax=Monilinia fructicola TaxID=38448 RepID=A0A5M9JDL8_MONFR|nr:hypothetical protein EYC84_009946 [Monilinia fructicola]
MVPVPGSFCKVLPTVKEAMEKLKPDATGIYVAAHQAASAIEEAIEAEVPLIVAVAEHIPLHDMLRIHSILDTQTKSRLVGANTSGIISAIGKCRIGFQPLSCFTPGRIGIVAKSGTLSYEAVASTTRAGLGQSLCIGMGGDILAGTNFVDALKVFEHDDDTEGIIIIGEIGGEAELEAAAWIEEYKKRSPNPKPIVALVAGIHIPHGKVMGHAGAFLLPGEPDAKTKIKAFEDVGVTMVNHPARFGDAMKVLLPDSGTSISGVVTSGTSQKRHIHTKRVCPTSRASTMVTQKRTLYLRAEGAMKLLDEKNIPRIKKLSKAPSRQHRKVTIGIDRSNRCPCIRLQDPNAESDYPVIPEKISFSYNSGPSNNILKNFANRHPDLHSLPRADPQHHIEAEAAKHGIVYIRFPGKGNIGTLVNGAGLAMNTVDALADAGGYTANFLDTGGKATTETVKRSFEAILGDHRVKVVFVNIFGGLTLGDMIAEGIILAFRECKVEVPVVVRIRGTNEREGQRIIAESGLPLYAYDDFDEAVAKVIDLANSREAENCEKKINEGKIARA